MQQGCVLFCSLIIVQMLAWPLRTPHMFVLKLGLCVGWQSRISVIRSWFYPADPCFNQDDQLRSRVVSELRWYNTSLQTTFCSLCESDHLLLTSNFKQFTQTSHHLLPKSLAVSWDICWDAQGFRKPTESKSKHFASMFFLTEGQTMLSHPRNNRNPPVH